MSDGIGPHPTEDPIDLEPRSLVVMPDPTDTARTRALRSWYRRTARDLPWRRDRDPWRVLVSEVMLQQTQASRVAAIFEEFLARFPTPHAMAATGPDLVVAEWSRHRLGYHGRARRLHAAARLIASGGWPQDAAALRSLPGVGTYTAAAVASIAFAERVAAIDTNVRRVLSRWVGRPLAGGDLAAVARDHLERDAATWNQALMELGALVCRPRPECTVCPVTTWCADPGIYVAPRPQGRFEGSGRQARGAIVRALAQRGAATRSELVTRTGLSSERVEAALSGLIAESLLERVGIKYRLATEASLPDGPTRVEQGRP